MLDINWIKENQNLVQSVADQKGISISISELIKWDNKRRELLLQVELQRQEKNKITREISSFIKTNERDKVEQKKQMVKEINDRLSKIEIEHKEAEKQCLNLLLKVPNIVSPDTPYGQSDKDNVVVKRVGQPRRFEFEPKDHVTLGEIHQIIDIPRAVKTSGSRNYYLKGIGVALHRAVQQLALDVLVEKGFTLLEVPLMVRTESLFNTGFFPLGEETTYKIEGTDKWLVGTSEVSLVSYYGNEFVNIEVPIKLAAVSQCFRNEVGSAGRDVHGLYRVHQFTKVEQVIICENNLEKSEQLFQEITMHAEEILTKLELPYQVVQVCTGDMSQKTYKQFDIETWMPSRNAYGETHSSSHLLDFQARRSNIKYRDENGNAKYCYTLNNTAVASPRILIPLLENHQAEDGSIRIPYALRKYLNGMERFEI